MKKRVNIFWFRRDLRLEDNAGLFHALNGSEPVLPIFIFDTEILDDLRDPKDARLNFIYDQVKAINNKLKEAGSALFAYHGKPVEVFKTLLEEHNIINVFTNRDYEPYAKERDHSVEKLLGERSIPFHTYKDHVILESKELVKDDGDPYKVYTPYMRRWKSKVSDDSLKAYHSEKLINNFFKTKHDYFPALSDLGFEPSDIKIPPLEIKRKRIEQYDKKRDFPAEKGTSRLGIHLRHGTISIREVVKEAKRLNETFLEELIWRDFYIMILDNFPNVVNEEFHSKYKDIPWRYDKDDFQKWCEGKTGYPIVDAGMRQLNETGYMHNRVRMITASFLTKHLLIDWRWGEAYFGEKLLDYELASNNGGWQWAAGCGTDTQPYFRIFNPESQMKKFDPDMEYVKKWVPEINTKDYPEPIIDHKFARERAIDTFKKTLQNENR